MTTSETRTRIDLNADLGEGFGRWSLGEDDALLELITSANFACGFHAGDPTIMRRVCAGAREHGVAVGAQVSYRDLARFGRRPISMPGVSAQDPEQAQSIVDAVLAVDAVMPLLVLPGTELEAQARRPGLTTVPEAFPDRAYEPNGMLRSRRSLEAELHDVGEITRRALDLACRRVLTAHDGSVLALDAESMCLHGDNDEAVAAARSIVAGLRDAGVELTPFIGSR